MEHGRGISRSAETGIDPRDSVELVRNGQHGDVGAVNELLKRYMPRMQRVIGLLLCPWQRVRIDPDDVLQETMIVATRRLPELDVRTASGIHRWLARIVAFKIQEQLEYLGAAKRDPGRERRMRADEWDSTDTGVVVAFAGPTPSEVLARRELDEQVDEHVARLEPPDFREVILLRDYQEAAWEEIRVRLGRPSIAAVKDLHERARKRLAERLESDTSCR
jgi:DNA-directed RNA polymerase specialized sigma24 family protein